MTLPTTTRRTVDVGAKLDQLIPVIVLGLWLFWIGDSGGYGQTAWYPSALGMTSLWILVLLRHGSVLPSNRAARVALLSFAALVAFNYLTLAWAGSRGSVLDSSNQLTLYLLGAWVLAMVPWTPERLAAFVGLWSLGVCVLCAESLGRAVSASSLTSFFVVGRFATPMHYSNATAALGVMGGWPALILSSRREVPVLLRGVLLGIATFLATFAVLPQSRAALLGMILTAPLTLIVTSSRGRMLVALLITGGAIAYCLPRLVNVNDAVDAGRDVTPVLSHAATAMLVSAIVAGALGLVASGLEDRLARAWADRRPGQRDGPVVRWRRRLRRSARQLGLGAAGVAAIVTAVAIVLAWPQITNLVHQTIHKGNTDAQAGTNRFLSISPEERFDYDRVALHLFSGAPVGGVGSGNFGRRYDGLRRFAKHSNYTHNLPLRVLSETGIVGEALFLCLCAALVVGMIRVARSRTDLGRACVAVAFAVSGYFLVHSCLDWVDEFPALAAPAVGLPLASMALGAGPRTVASARSSVSRFGVALAGLGALAATAAVATSYLSLMSINRAFAVFTTDPGLAYRDLRLARSLDPLSVNPVTSEGTIALYAGNTDRAQAAFTRAARVQDDWYPRLELALIAASDGRFVVARRQLDDAARLDVDDPLITEARELIDRRQRINPFRFNAQILQEGTSSASPQQIIR